MTDKRSFDSSYKARTINLIISDIDFKYSPAKDNFYEDYFNDVITHRNILAHCCAIIKENGTEILKTQDEEEKEYTSNDIKEIRKNIKKYREIFNQLGEEINKQNKNEIAKAEA